MNLKTLLCFWLFVCMTSFCQTQTLASFFTPSDLATLERLILLAETHDLQITESQLALKLSQATFTPEGRLAQALSVSTSASLSGDLYGQAVPSYAVSLSLDVMKLLEANSGTELLEKNLSSARAASRLRVVEAFVAYKLALLRAETSARAVEASEASYQLELALVSAGESILSAQIRAQSELASTVFSLYQANGAVIVELEKLAATVGISKEAVIDILKEEGQ